jgi:hypothetical protein
MINSEERGSAGAIAMRKLVFELINDERSRGLHGVYNECR